MEFVGGGGLGNKPNELERFSKNKKRNRIVIGSIIGMVVLVGSILLYRSYALYKEEKEFNVIQGRIPDFNYDVKLAIVVDGEKQERIPEKPETGSYIVDVVCDKGNGSWDYKNWRVQVSEFTNNTKCNVSFTTSEEEINLPILENNIDIYCSITLYMQTHTVNNIPQYTNEINYFHIYIRDGEVTISGLNGKQSLTQSGYAGTIGGIKNLKIISVTPLND